SILPKSGILYQSCGEGETEKLVLTARLGKLSALLIHERDGVFVREPELEVLAGCGLEYFADLRAQDLASFFLFLREFRIQPFLQSFTQLVTTDEDPRVLVVFEQPVELAFFVAVGRSGVA